jgi:hypothetical protein
MNTYKKSSISKATYVIKITGEDVTKSSGKYATSIGI